MGATAAVAFMFVMIPDDPFRFVAVSLVAGFGGKSILESVLQTITAKILKLRSTWLISGTRDITGDIRGVVGNLEADISKGHI